VVSPLFGRSRELEPQNIIAAISPPAFGLIGYEKNLCTKCVGLIDGGVN
jgi:hypothetical protein